MTIVKPNIDFSQLSEKSASVQLKRDLPLTHMTNIPHRQINSTQHCFNQRCVQHASLAGAFHLGRDAANQGDSDSEVLFIVPPFKEIALLELDV